MKKLILTLVMAAAFVAGAQAQTSPEQTFFNSVGDYFTSFNTNLLTFQKNKFEVWTGVAYQQNVDVANVLGVDFDVKKGGGFYVEGTMANAGIAGTVLNLAGGGGYSIVKYDTRLSFGVNGGYDFQIKQPIVEIYGDVRKSLTENTFAGLRLSYETSFSGASPHAPLVLGLVGFTF